MRSSRLVSLILTGMLSAVSSGSWAQSAQSGAADPEAAVGSTGTTGASTSTSETPATATTSTTNSTDPRAGKRVTIGLEPLGFPVLLPAFGGTVGFLARPDVAVELNHVRNGFDIYVIEVYTRVTSLRVKKYWGDSFYTNVGLAQRTVGARFSLDDLAIDELDTETEITSLVGDLAIGNQWQWDHWAFGVDWFGWMPHIRVLESHDNYPYEQASKDEKDERSRFDKLASRGNPQFMRFYVGMSF